MVVTNKKRNKRRSQLSNCAICQKTIDGNKGNFLKCFYCETFAHISCAKKSKLLATNGFYYCNEHKNHATNFMPPPNPEINTHATQPAPSAIVNQISLEQLSQILQSLSIQIVSDSHDNKQNDNENLRKNNAAKADNVHPHQSTMHDPPAPIKPPPKRTPNFNAQHDSFRPLICQKCQEGDLDVQKDFKCRICYAYFHDSCLSSKERINEIGGFWGCNECVEAHRDFEKQFHPPNSSVINNDKTQKSPVQDQSSLSAEWKSLLDFFIKEQQKVADEIMVKVDEKFKAFESRFHRINTQTDERQGVDRQENPKLNNFQSSSSGQNSEPNREHLSPKDIEAIVEASIRRSRGLNDAPGTVHNQDFMREEMQQSNEMQRQLLANQLLESRKNSYRKLPTVKKDDYQWKVFYKAFQETKNLFTDQENVTRIEEAIQCDAIRNLGGSNIFTLSTYEDALMLIDKRIGKPEKLMMKEKQTLISFGKLSNGDRKKIIQFIQEVNKYANLVDKIGSYQNKADVGLINRLSRMLPDYLLNAWAKEFNKIQEDTGEVLLSDLALWLNNQIDNLDRIQLFDSGDPYSDQKGQKSFPNKEKSGNKFQKKEVMFSHNDVRKDVKSSNYPKRDNTNQKKADSKESDFLGNYCWYHGKSGHSSLHCYSLLTKTGQEVTRIAKERNICIVCSRNSHFPCPYKEKLKCLIPSCKYKHAFIFCFTRNCHQTVDLKTKDVVKKDEINHHIQQKCHENPSQNPINSPEGLSNHMINALGNELENFSDSESSNVMVEKSATAVESHTQHAEKSKPSISDIAKLSVVCVKLFNEGKAVTCALLLDSGSTMSMIDAKYAQLLNVTGPKAPIQIHWSGGQSREDNESYIVKLKAQGIQKNAVMYDIHFRAIHNLNMPSQNFNAKAIKSQYPHLNKIPLQSYSQVIGVIGTDQHWFFQQQKWIKSKNRIDAKEAPVAILTPLGYSVIGGKRTLPKIHKNLKASLANSCLHTECALSVEENNELLAIQERIMGLDYLHPYENDRKIAEEVQALKCLEANVKKVPNKNCYEAPLLFREPNPSLPTSESYKVALKRTLILIKHAKNIGKLQDINLEIKNLIQKDYARKLSQDEIKNPPNNAFYIPIFLSAQKGKRIRLIWDAAAKVADKSLNDFLLSGPNLYVNLLSLIMKAREGKYLAKADISEMFHQVLICKKDRPALRFLFPDENTNQINHYEMNVMVFGVVCSPTTSQFIKNLIANEAEKEFPLASKILKDHTYVDDVVTSSNDKECLKQAMHDARKILKEGGFNLVKLASNSPEILDKIKENLSAEDMENPKIFSLENEEKLLGYMFNYKTDEISLADIGDKFSESFLSGTKVPTKRDVLRLLMSLFDPLGIAAFFTSKLKIIYHWTCQSKIDWKEKIPEKIVPYWKKVLEWLPEVLTIKIPRAYLFNFQKVAKTQLFIFGDAGKDMLCNVAYVRFVDAVGTQIGYNFLASKTYTVPLKQKRSIPELELDVAEKAVEFKRLIINSHSIKFNECYFATDSTCVYTWITKGINKATLYVKRRLGKIHAGSSKDEWIWVKSELQPADYGTKFEAMPSLNNLNDWFKPKVFSLPEENWLRKSPPIGDQSHFIVVNATKKDNDNDFWIKKYSSFNRMRNCLTLVYEFKHRLQKKVLNRKLKEAKNSSDAKAIEEKIKKVDLIQNNSLIASELNLIKMAQKDIYGDEIKKLKRNEKLQKQSKLFKFSPFLDSENVLRVKTRLPEEYEYDKRFPIVLPNKHRLTKLIIMQYHENNRHQLHKNVIIELSQRFFIPSIVNSVKATIKELCMKCKRENAKPDRPMMGDLPSYRLANKDPPFSYIIIDVCGPFSIRVNRRTEKRWVLVISCLTTRAVHLEVLYTMNSQSLLMALENLINIRGAPKRIISDNGSNFVGGNKILQELQEKWDKKLAMKGMIAHKIEWEFSPAKAASMNGSVERMVALVKSVLKKMYDSLDKNMIVPSDEVFQCMLKEIIGLLNNRPLTMMPINGTSNSFLTPNYFLTQRQDCKVTPISQNNQLYQLKKWEDVKDLMSILWDHFNKSYVYELLFRQKWFAPKRNLEVGDVVVTADPTVVNLWRLGVIINITEGSKEQVRKVTVRLGKRNKIPKASLSSKEAIMNKIALESHSDITRPASEVACINLKSLEYAKK